MTKGAETKKPVFYDRTHRKVGDGSEDTQTIVNFFVTGLSQEERDYLERARLEREKEELNSKKAELMRGFLEGEFGDKTVIDLPEKRQNKLGA